jgi:hypothetical protein
MNIIKEVCRQYDKNGSIKETAVLCRISEQKYRKILITQQKWNSEISKQIIELYKDGFNVQAISDIFHKEKNTISGYLPYEKGIYSKNRTKDQNEKIKEKKPNVNEDNLILISEYAKMHGKSKRTIKDKCKRGGFKTAIQISGMWLIDKNEPYTDLRTKEHTINKKSRFTDEELINKLRDYSKDGHVPVANEVRNPYYKTYQNHFGSWENALKLAGINKDK